jgi:hypothetical protein
VGAARAGARAALCRRADSGAGGPGAARGRAGRGARARPG